MCYLLFNSAVASTPTNWSLNLSYAAMGEMLPMYNDTTPGGHEFDSNNSAYYEADDSGIKFDYKIRRAVEKVVTPLICAFGLVGNIFNLVIFARRCRFGQINVLEKGAIFGLASLAASDLAFCFITCIGIFVPYHGALFLHRDFAYFYQLYAGILQNVFIKASTWLTTIACVSRYAAVCYPLWARQFIRLSYIKTAVIIVLVISTLIHIPLIWNHKIYEMKCGNTTLIILDSGYFVETIVLRTVFTYIWAILGYIVPAVIMMYCNACLIISFRQSTHVRQEMRQASCQMTHAQERITVTLIVVVLLYIILISPSEILHIYAIIGVPSNGRLYIMALVSDFILHLVVH